MSRGRLVCTMLLVSLVAVSGCLGVFEPHPSATPRYDVSVEVRNAGADARTLQGEILNDNETVEHRFEATIPGSAERTLYPFRALSRDGVRYLTVRLRTPGGERTDTTVETSNCQGPLEVTIGRDGGIETGYVIC